MERRRNGQYASQGDGARSLYTRWIVIIIKPCLLQSFQFGQQSRIGSQLINIILGANVTMRYLRRLPVIIISGGLVLTAYHMGQDDSAFTSELGICLSGWADWDNWVVSVSSDPLSAERVWAQNSKFREHFLSCFALCFLLNNQP
jgi:hypothetical protein